MKPQRLAPNNFHRFYRGGTGIAAFRGIPFSDPFTPEDWIGSTTSLFGCDGPGLSMLEDGRLLRDAVKDDADAFLGPAHVARWGADPALLVKLLDPDQRLPIHCHPNRAFSRRHLGLRYGKTEAWIVIATRTPGAKVYLGFRERVDLDRLAGWVDRQDGASLLASVNVFGIKAGDTVFVPAGIPHAVGEGILIVELQEPTDLSILMEWTNLAIDGRKEGHLGLGFERALEGVDRSPWPDERLKTLVNGGSGTSLFSSDADPFFRAHVVKARDRLEPGFSILVVLKGHGSLDASEGGTLELRRGDTILIPYGAGECRLAGELSAIRCQPPDPAAA